MKRSNLIDAAKSAPVNLKAIQRFDSIAVEIIDIASQVALYNYETELEKWCCEMTSRSETEINLKTLQRTDSHIIEIIDNASQVAIYKYDEKSRKWESTGIGGALFLYRR
ncbi:hypothetical protein CEXT_41821 [Caerostris extrusa]|uniref:Uncharacterized protein n=1 Tax=Caerostris extrusa TaxID=172846 RepID=A0AAV4T079_CAEEX|nr:hypothetical protein CEXT_41821 [Caerostris extrusa]